MLTMHRRLHDGYAPTNVQATTPRAAGERRCDPSDALVSAPELRPPFRHITVLASVRWTPDPQWRMTRGVLDVSVDGEHLQVVTEAQAHEEGIDGPELHALAPAPVSDVGSRNVIVATRDNHREHREASSKSWLIARFVAVCDVSHIQSHNFTNPQPRMFAATPSAEGIPPRRLP